MLNVSNAAAADSAGPSLGIIAENSSHAQKPGFGGGRRRRYKLLAAARKLLPDQRVAQCQYAIAPEYRAVGIEVNDVEERASFRNLIKCDSPQCPFCSVVRSERDRHELTIALAEAQRLGYFPLLLTFTLSHHTADSLDDLRSALRTAFDKVFSGRWYQVLRDEYGMAGKITATETTYGKNGWHPHLHVIAFFTMDFDLKSLERIRSEIGQRWQDKLKTLGFTANLANGLNIRSADSDVADYVAKWGHEPLDGAWGADTEIAKANVKRASRGGLTPFQLLGVVAGIQADCDAAMLLLGCTDLETLKKRCSALFCEYWYAYKGRARLHWGEMRKLLDLDIALENYELLNHEEPPETWDIVFIERGENWNKVRGKGGDDLRAELLEVCASRDAWKVRSWLAKNGISGHVPYDAYARSLNIVKVSNESEELL